MGLKTMPLLVLILALLLAGCSTRPTAIQIATDSATNDGIEVKSEVTAEAPASAPSEPVELNVFAAASLTGPFSEIGKLFETNHPRVKVVFNFAGSQQLAQQINEGAPADVFASADKTQLNAVIEAGGIISGTQQTFGGNRLVVIYPQDNPASLNELKDLANPGLKVVFAAKEVPVGGYTLVFLDKAASDKAFGATFKADVLGNVVSYEDNVKAVLAKVVLGEADAGIVYASDLSTKDASKVGRIDIPNALNAVALYPIAPVKDSKNPDLAQMFIELVLSQEGQDILAKYNFMPVR